MIMKRKLEERRPYDAWDMSGFRTTPWVAWLAVIFFIIMGALFLFGVPPAP